MSNGWDESAGAWIRSMGEYGDFSRHAILDPPMLAQVTQSGARSVLDLGCGEGRFCRLMRAEGLDASGIDPSEALIAEARRRDPDGDYRVAAAEKLPFADESFDMVVAYLSLIDIAEIGASIAEARRVLRPGGHLLIANLNSFFSAANPAGWQRDEAGYRYFQIDHYMDERMDWVGWAGIRVQNWHRPLGTYMALLLGAGLQLRHFEEPLPLADYPAQLAEFRRVPAFLVMDWVKPE